MSISRLAIIGLVCLVANACTVVVQPAADQPEPNARASEPEADVGAADPEPVRRPPLEEPRRRPTDPEPDPGYYEPESPARRPPGGSTASNLGIPPGHLPGPGECRAWVPGTPPGRQARARSCHGILATAPVGSWILYRPAQYQRQVRVRYLHETQQMVIAVRAFDAETGVYLRDLALAEDDNNMGPLATAVGRPTTRPSDGQTGTPGNSGNAPGRTGTANDRGTSAGNSGIPAGRPDTTGNRRSDGGNSGVAAGGADTTRGKPTTVGSRGNQGGDNRSANTAGKSPNQGQGNSTSSIDTTTNTRTTGNSSGVAAGQADSTSSRRTARGNTGVAARRTDSTGVAGVVGGGGAAATDDPRRDDLKIRADRGGEPEDTSLGSFVQSYLGIEARYLPRPGQCRVWIPGQPFARQARAASCDGIADGAPAGAWIVRRSTAQPDVIVVDYVDEETPGVVVRTSAFDAATGAALRSARQEPR